MMTSRPEVDTAESTLRETTEPYPYPPSFIDRFRDAIERLPVSYWLTYLVLFILESFIFHLGAWMDGWLPAYSSNPILFLFPLWQWAPFAIMTYLDSISLQALSRFSLLLDLDEQTMRRLRYEFGTMPAKSVLASGAFWIIFYSIFTYLGFPTVQGAMGSGTGYTIIFTLIGGVTFFTGSIIYYHTLRQLILVYRTVNTVKHYDLFQLDPVYAFSKVTSRTGIAWVFLLTCTLLTFPVQLAIVATLSLLVLQLVMAISAFVLPLWSVNQRLVLEKRALVAENDLRIKTMLARLHSGIDQDELDGLHHIHDSINGLNAEREILLRIPTWPWRAGLLPGFISLIGLPIVTFILQLAIGRWLGK